MGQVIRRRVTEEWFEDEDGVNPADEQSVDDDDEDDAEEDVIPVPPTEQRFPAK
jgi:hypothetical protein